MGELEMLLNHLAAYGHAERKSITIIDQTVVVILVHSANVHAV